MVLRGRCTWSVSREGRSVHGALTWSVFHSVVAIVLLNMHSKDSARLSTAVTLLWPGFAMRRMRVMRLRRSLGAPQARPPHTVPSPPPRPTSTRPRHVVTHLQHDHYDCFVLLTLPILYRLPRRLLHTTPLQLPCRHCPTWL
jgi:hypothetical protein